MPLAVCATPIGNLEDVTLRVLAELAAADVVLCEDTRHTRVLLERHGVKARLLSYHEHNEAQRTAQLLPRLEAGERVALVSDAGLPGVSDPGARLVRSALGAGIDVTVLPGASAVETALVASGLVAEQYRFLGFLPRSSRRSGCPRRCSRSRPPIQSGPSQSVESSRSGSRRSSGGPPPSSRNGTTRRRRARSRSSSGRHRRRAAARWRSAHLQP
jgi:hypothetical protein